MAKIVVVNAEGVLCRRDRKDNPFRAYHPIAEGMGLVAALSSSYNIAVASTQTDADEVTTWLKENGMAAYFSYVVPRKVTWPEERAECFVAQVDHMRSCGFSIGMAVDSDPMSIGLLMAKGVTGVTFTQPQYARPEWRPDDPRGARAWADIEAEVERQALLKADDARVGDAEIDGRYEVV